MDSLVYRQKKLRFQEVKYLVSQGRAGMNLSTAVPTILLDFQFHRLTRNAIQGLFQETSDTAQPTFVSFQLLSWGTVTRNDTEAGGPKH
jgi:hypothetical protein